MNLRLYLVIACFLIALCACSLVGAQQNGETPAGTAIEFGDAHFRLPVGWKRSERNSGKMKALVMIPGSLKPGQEFALLLLPGEDLNGVELKQAMTVLVKKSLSDGEHALQTSEIQARKTEAGYDLLTCASVVEDAAGHRTVRLSMAANPNKRLEVLIAMADSQTTLQQYQTDLAALLGSFTFGKATPAVSEPHTATTTSVGTHGETASAATIPAGKGAPIVRGLWVDAGPTTRSADGRKSGSVFIKDLAVDLTEHTIYAAAASIGDFEPQGGLFASHDGGQTWQTLYRENCLQIVPTGSNRIYALQRLDGQVIRSDDRGHTWTKCTRPRYQGRGFTDYAAVECIAASPADPNVLYLGASGLYGAGLYKSLDGGRTWTRPLKQALHRGQGARDAVNYNANTISEIVPDPVHPDTLYAHIEGFQFQSHDGGVHFFDCLDYTPDSGSPTDSPQPIKVVRPGSFQIDPALPQFGYLHYGSKLYRTGDGGRHWTQITLPGVQFIHTIAAHPGAPQIVYAATDQQLYVSGDAGHTWSALKSGNAPRATGGFTIPREFNGTAFNSVATVVRDDEPILLDPQTGHLLYGTALGLRILVTAK